MGVSAWTGTRRTPSVICAPVRSTRGSARRCPSQRGSEHDRRRRNNSSLGVEPSTIAEARAGIGRDAGPDQSEARPPVIQRSYAV
jgi:hypothetical protein